MLQIEKSPSIDGARDADGRDFVSPAELLTSFVDFVRRQSNIIIFVVLLSFGCGAVYVFTAPPRYTGHAAMIIDTRKIQLFQQQSVLGDIPVDSATVESQVEILKSENIALSVIKDLHLTEDPEFVSAGGGLIGTLLDLVLSPFASDEPTSEFALQRRALGVFQKYLTIKRVGLTYVIDIAFQSLNPDRAAEIANGVADAYIVDQLEAKYQATRRATNWLQDRLRELRAQASNAERALVDFKAKNNIIESGGRLMNEQQLAELNSALIQARAQTAEAKARLDRINEVTRKDSSGGNFSETATVADTLHNEVITKLRQQYLEYSAREADWSRRYGHDHLAAVNLRNQMREIRKSILDELGRIGETYKSDYEIAKAREESVQKSLSSIITESNTTNQAQIAMRELESNSQTYRALYDNFLQRYMESVQQQSFPITEARLITKASRPLGKSSPKTFLILVLATGGGLILGFGIAMLRDISDQVFRTDNQVESILQASCIAVLPIMKGGAKWRVPVQQAAGKAIGRQAIAQDQSILRYVLESPFSRFTEAVRSIKVATDVSRITKSIKVVGVTSALPNEGKSTVATALAQLTAHSGARVLLIDCDLRNPDISRKLAPNANLGLIDVVTNKASFEEAIWTDQSTNLAFLPVVTESRLIHTNEILASDAMKQLFEKLRNSYDYIVVDLSPLAPVVDVRATTNLIDSYLFVIEWGRTHIDVVKHSLNSAREVSDNIFGVVLNKADVNMLGRYQSYHGKYYHNRYYARYGYTD
jgi:succinoglycan biosynthesis transport protein ExoP